MHAAWKRGYLTSDAHTLRRSEGVGAWELDIIFLVLPSLLGLIAEQKDLNDLLKTFSL